MSRIRLFSSVSHPNATKRTKSRRQSCNSTEGGSEAPIVAGLIFVSLEEERKRARSRWATVEDKAGSDLWNTKGLGYRHWA